MAEVQRHNDVTVIVLDAAYDALDQKKFEAVQELLLSHAQTAEPPLVALDLSSTAYMGSAFIQVLFRSWKYLNGRQGQLVLCGVQPFCREVLHTTRLDAMVQSFEDVPAAVEALAAK